MRAAVPHFIFGVVLIAAGVLATMFFQGFYWFGAYIVGGIEIIRAIVIAVRSPRLPF